MRGLLVRNLVGSRLNVTLLHRRPLLWPWPGGNSATPAIKAPVVTCIAYNGTVNISIMYYGSVYAHYSGVVAETAAFPSAAAIAVSAITVAIVNTAIKANMWPPVAGIKSVYATGIAPISRRPVKAGIWRCHPDPGYPVIAAFVIIISPVTWLPYIAVGRAFRLHVNPQWRWRCAYSYAYAHLGICSGCGKAHHTK